LCGDQTTVEACHVNMADGRIAKPNSFGMKAEDCFIVPLCGRHHRRQHEGSERKFWQILGIDPIVVSLAIFAKSVFNDYEGAELICRHVEINYRIRRADAKPHHT
jgi:hypothetical protein